MFLLVVVISCEERGNSMPICNETPLASVVKLISAQSMGYVEVAKEYIDVKKVYSKHIGDSIDYDKFFAEQVGFMSSTTDSRKFTNHFKYFNYRISEIQNGSTAKVEFRSKDREASLQGIIYDLENRDCEWIVVGIVYEKD